MTVNAKGTFKVKAQLKMNGISFDLKMANEAANILRPKFKKLRIPRGKIYEILNEIFIFIFFRFLLWRRRSRNPPRDFKTFLSRMSWTNSIWPPFVCRHCRCCHLVAICLTPYIWRHLWCHYSSLHKFFNVTLQSPCKIWSRVIQFYFCYCYVSDLLVCISVNL